MSFHDDCTRGMRTAKVSRPIAQGISVQVTEMGTLRELVARPIFLSKDSSLLRCSGAVGARYFVSPETLLGGDASA